MRFVLAINAHCKSTSLRAKDFVSLRACLKFMCAFSWRSYAACRGSVRDAISAAMSCGFRALCFTGMLFFRIKRSRCQLLEQRNTQNFFLEKYVAGALRRGNGHEKGLLLWPQATNFSPLRKS